MRYTKSQSICKHLFLTNCISSQHNDPKHSQDSAYVKIRGNSLTIIHTRSSKFFSYQFGSPIPGNLYARLNLILIIQLWFLKKGGKNSFSLENLFIVFKAEAWEEETFGFLLGYVSLNLYVFLATCLNAQKSAKSREERIQAMKNEFVESCWCFCCPTPWWPRFWHSNAEFRALVWLMNFGPNSYRIKKIPTSCVRISSRPKAIIYWITNLNRVLEHDFNFTPLSESLAFDSSARSSCSSLNISTNTTNLRSTKWVLL